MNKNNSQSTRWQRASELDWDLLATISFLLQGYPELISFIFDPKYPRLRADSASIKRDARRFSTGEYILITLALDLWDGSGETKVRDMFNNLDNRLIKRALLAISKERGVSL